MNLRLNLGRWVGPDEKRRGPLGRFRIESRFPSGIEVGTVAFDRQGLRVNLAQDYRAHNDQECRRVHAVFGPLNKCATSEMIAKINKR